jgi:hypothetical protein
MRVTRISHDHQCDDGDQKAAAVLSNPGFVPAD